MTYIKPVEPSEAEGTVKKVYDEVQEKFGIVPSFIKVFGIRPDILEGIWTLGERIMDEQHALNSDTKALTAAFVSKVNSCEY